MSTFPHHHKIPSSSPVALVQKTRKYPKPTNQQASLPLPSSPTSHIGPPSSWFETEIERLDYLTDRPLVLKYLRTVYPPHRRGQTRVVDIEVGEIVQISLVMIKDRDYLIYEHQRLRLEELKRVHHLGTVRIRATFSDTAQDWTKVYLPTELFSPSRLEELTTTGPELPALALAPAPAPVAAPATTPAVADTKTHISFVARLLKQLTWKWPC